MGDVVAIAGDWHGNRNWAAGRIRSCGDRGISTLLHVGDFGIWPGGDGARFLTVLEAACARHEVNILVTPGNHEDWGMLSARWSAQLDGGCDEMIPIQLTEHITVLPRGFRWAMNGRSFVSLGGAPSIDFRWRTEGIDWWRDEMIRASDVDRVVADGYADVMIAHDAPGEPYLTDAVRGIKTNNPEGWDSTELAYAAEGTELMHAAFLGVAPRLFVHGHFHVGGEATFKLPGRDYETTMWSLPAEQNRDNLRLLDLRSLTEPGSRK